jgi:8-oxo-dGTP pyrophosphatase MutT (NUDIX family)
MKIATLAIITRDNTVLLGRNKKGFAEGKLNGPGGKKEPTDETIEECVVRETEEEVGIRLDPAKLEKTAVITFYAGGVSDFEVHVYTTSHFTDEPHETESMVPGWYPIDQLPVDQMLESDRMWFPQAIRGEKFYANVYYEERMKGFLSIEFLPFNP